VNDTNYGDAIINLAKQAAHGVLVAQGSDVATRLMHELGTTKHSKPPL
jgi:hypothetical protein